MFAFDLILNLFHIEQFFHQLHNHFFFLKRPLDKGADFLEQHLGFLCAVLVRFLFLELFSDLFGQGFFDLVQACDDWRFVLVWLLEFLFVLIYGFVETLNWLDLLFVGCLLQGSEFWLDLFVQVLEVLLMGFGFVQLGLRSLKGWIFFLE